MLIIHKIEPLLKTLAAIKVTIFTIWKLQLGCFGAKRHIV